MLSNISVLCFIQRTFSFLVTRTHFTFANICLLLISTSFVFAVNEPGDLRKQAQKAMRQGEFATAEQLWQEFLTANPKHIESRLELSYAYYKQRKLVDAYQTATNVLQTDPKNSRAHALVGVALLGAGNLKLANSFFNEANALNPDEPLAFAGSGLLDYYENRTKRALPKLRQAVYLEPREPDFAFALAQVATRAENYKEAADAYERFLRIAPITYADRRERIQGLIDFLRFLGNRKSLHEPAGHTQTTVACEIVNNRPVIQVRINGNPNPFRFVLDTGSGTVVVSDETAKLLNLKPVAQGGQARAIGGVGKFPIVYGFLSSFEIGEVKIRSVPVYIRQFHQTTDKIDGYIGLSAISKFLTTLDYVQKTFTLVRLEKERKDRDEEASPQLELSELPLRFTTGGFLSGEVKVKGIETSLNFIVDTGASVSVVDAQIFNNYQMNRYQDTSMFRVVGAAGITENVISLNLPEVKFGEQKQEKVQAAVLNLGIINEVTGFEQAGILGGNFLRNYRLTFDFRNLKVKLEPTAAFTQKNNGSPEIINEITP